MRFSTWRETKISELMIDKGILTTDDLSIENLSDKFNIDVIYGPKRSHCIHEDDEYALIFIDSRLSLYEQRCKFFHEFAHVISHPGNQKNLPEDFSKLQEEQANCLSLYVAMPRHIFIPAVKKYQSINTLEELFQLPEEYIVRRFMSIRNQIKSQAFQNVIQLSETKRRRKSLQPEHIYESTKLILQQLADQVGADNINADIRKLL